MTKNTFCVIGCGSVVLTTATAAVQINQHRVICGFAAPGSHVSCLDNGSCATRTGANSKFELILWNKSCKCASIAVQKQNFGPSTTWTLPPTIRQGAVFDLRLCQHRIGSIFGPARTFEICDSGEEVGIQQLVDPGFVLAVVAGSLFCALVVAWAVQMMLASDSAPHDSDLQSESSYESESDDGENSPPVISAVPVQLCTHVAEDSEGYNLRSQCKKCAARIGLSMTVMESPEAPTPAAIDQFVFGADVA